MEKELYIKQLKPFLYLMDEAHEATGYIVVGDERVCVIDTMNGYNDLHKVVREITDKPIKGGDVIDLGGKTLEVYELPGHTPGGILLLLREERILFTGDSVNHHLWMQLDGCPEMQEYVKALDKIMFLEKEADVILHGHATGFDDISLLRCMRQGAVEICNGETENDLPYNWFGGVAKQHPFKLENDKEYDRAASVICYR